MLSGKPYQELVKIGPKETARGQKAVCSGSHPLVTQVMLDILKRGGNAVDAALAGCLLQAVVEPHMSNHAGTASFLYWDADQKKAYQLNGTGTFVPGLAPFRPVPPIGIRFAMPGGNPCALIPGFMPAVKAMYDKFASLGWQELCSPALETARCGHVMTSFEHAVLSEELPFYTYFPEGRALFTPSGFLPEVGEVFHNPDLAATLEGLAVEGPDYFINGKWALDFVKKANQMGWLITLEDLQRTPPRWQEPLRYACRGHEIIQFSPPERTGVFTALVMGILNHLQIEKMGPVCQSADSLYVMAHALRRAHFEVGNLNDPFLFEQPLDIWLSEDFQAQLAEVIWRSRPKADLTEHWLLTQGKPALLAAGAALGGGTSSHQQSGSCEISVLDAQGNRVQMLHTLQAGGIPGMVVGGVPMVGCHALTNLQADIAGWFAGGGRIKCILGCTFVLKDGEPWMGLGSPGNIYATLPQVLSGILDYGLSPQEAVDLPRMDPLRDDYVLEIESRLKPYLVEETAARGILIRPLPMYDYNMGSFQITWKDRQNGLLYGLSDPRRAGQAAGF